MRATVTTSSSTVAAREASGSSRSDESAQSFLIKNMSGTKTSVFLEVGDAATTADGFEWEADDPPLEITLEYGEELNAIVSSGTQTLHVLRTGR